jgi:hypothetical protein
MEDQEDRDAGGADHGESENVGTNLSADDV